jgi:hypothetical protein
MAHTKIASINSTVAQKYRHDSKQSIDANVNQY